MTKQLHILLTLLLAMIFTSGGAQTVVFNETFSKCTDAGGNDGKWSGSLSASSITDASDPYTDNSGWKFNGSCYTANNCVKIGATKSAGYANTPSISLTGNGTLTFKAGAWNGQTEKTTLQISATNAKLDKEYVTLTKGAFTDYTVKITNATGNVTIKFTGKESKYNRFFLDEVKITQSGSDTPSLQPAELSFSATSVTTKLGATFTAPTLSNPHNLNVTYTSSDATVATVAADGSVSPLKAGTTTITAKSEATDTYDAGESSYTLLVTPNVTGDGTEKNPYTVADAIALNAAGTLPSDSVYVKGVISKIDKIDTSFGNATYYISDDGTTTNQLEIYRGNNISNAKFTSEDQLLPKWTVTVKGVLTVYSNTLEMGQGNYITSIVKPSVDVPTITGTTAFFDNTTVTISADEGCYITYTTDGSNPVSSKTATTSDKNTVTFDLKATTTVKAVALDANAEMSSAVEQTFTKLDESNAISVADALTTADGTTVLVKGIVTRTSAFNSNYTNLNYYLADANAADNELEVYRGMGLKGADITSADDIARGDEVFVYGTLKTFNSTKELDASSIILKQTKAEEKTSITAAGWATYVTARSVDFSKTSDVKAYTVAYSTTDDAITLTPVTAVPGNTAVVLKGNQGDYTFTTTTDAAAVSKNNLKFYTKATEVAKAKTVYILANNNGTVGFCPATVGSTVPAYKGYLSISGGTSAKNFFALDGTATGINSIAADKANSRDVRFNLAGQRVDKNYKGVVIVNGKKQLVK